MIYHDNGLALQDVPHCVICRNTAPLLSLALKLIAAGIGATVLGAGGLGLYGLKRSAAADYSDPAYRYWLDSLRPEGMDPEAFKARCEEISRQCYELTAGLGGSASAEHGIGLLKAPWLSSTRSEAEIEMMRGIKSVFDPAGILKPGKLLGETET